MNNTYELNICGLKRKLPIVKINKNLAIASFVILGDTELITKSAAQIAKKLPSVDFLVTAEAKGIPLAFELSRILNMKEFIVARKSIKPYMKNPLVEEVFSITTQKKQILCLDEKEAIRLKGKKVAIIDDVISTGESLLTLEKLLKKAGASICAKAAVLAEGDAAMRQDIIFLEKLPLFQL